MIVYGAKQTSRRSLRLKSAAIAVETEGTGEVARRFLPGNTFRQHPHAHVHYVLLRVSPGSFPQTGGSRRTKTALLSDTGTGGGAIIDLRLPGPASLTSMIREINACRPRKYHRAKYHDVFSKYILQ